VCFNVESGYSDSLSVINEDFPKYLRIGGNTLELCLNSSLANVLENSGVHELLNMTKSEVSFGVQIQEKFDDIDWNTTISENADGYVMHVFNE
jgi:hypothetical protein